LLAGENKIGMKLIGKRKKKLNAKGLETRKDAKEGKGTI
jgi:hypothetical protein